MDYRRGLDLARIVAAFFVIWDHLHAPGWQAGDTALGLFLFLAAFLTVQSYERNPGTGFWRKRAARLLVPWLFWCVFYRVLDDVMSDGPFILLSDPLTLITGPHFHLWFLPFTAIWMVAATLLSQHVRSRITLAMAMGGLVALAVPLGWVLTNRQFDLPVLQWAFALPLFLLGALHAIALRLDAAWLTWAAAATMSAIVVVLHPEFCAVQAILTLVVFEFFWRLPIRATWPTTAAGYAFGVYLLHPFFILVAYKLFGVDVAPIPAALFTFACTLVATGAFLRLPVLNRFV